MAPARRSGKRLSAVSNHDRGPPQQRVRKSHTSLFPLRKTRSSQVVVLYLGADSDATCCGRELALIGHDRLDSMKLGPVRLLFAAA